MRAIGLAAIAFVFAAPGCVLPHYDKVGASKSPAQGADSGTDAGAGLAGASAECNSCIEENCAQQLSDCGPDCQGLTFPITPATPSPDALEPFLICAQNCEECNVKWGCVNHYRWPQATQPFTVTVRMIDIASSAPITDVSVLACQGSDPSCSPSAGLVGMGETNSMARATLAVPRDFVGTFQFTAGMGDYMPATALWSQPIYTVRDTFTQRMISWGVAEGLGAAAGAVVRRDAGHLIFRAHNCLPMRYMGATGELRADADGVSVSFTPPTKDSSKVFYTGTTGSLDPTLEGTASLGGAFGGAFNLPTTLTTVIAKRNGVEVSRAALQIRSGTVGFVYLIPNAL